MALPRSRVKEPPVMVTACGTLGETLRCRRRTVCVEIVSEEDGAVTFNPFGCGTDKSVAQINALPLSGVHVKLANIRNKAFVSPNVSNASAWLFLLFL